MNDHIESVRDSLKGNVPSVIGREDVPVDVITIDELDGTGNDYFRAFS